MALLDRVATLVRANLNDLVDRAEDPEKMIKQVILDMRNQLLQVKTQVAIAIADQHVLDKKRNEHEETAAQWMHKAELAVGKGQDDLARAALDRSMSSHNLSGNFEQQVADQKAQVETLKNALNELDRKLAEAQATSELLIARHRRSRALERATDARNTLTSDSNGAAFERMKNKVSQAEAFSQAKAELTGDNVEEQLARLERQDRVEKLLVDLKARCG